MPKCALEPSPHVVALCSHKQRLQAPHDHLLATFVNCGKAGLCRRHRPHADLFHAPVYQLLEMVKFAYFLVGDLDAESALFQNVWPVRFGSGKLSLAVRGPSSMNRFQMLPQAALRLLSRAPGRTLQQALCH